MNYVHSLGLEFKLKAKIKDGLIRISVGIENVIEIISDFEQKKDHSI